MIDAMKQGLAVINGLPTCNHHHGIDCPNCAHINNAAAALRTAIEAAERADAVWIRSDQLQQARIAPQLCRVEPAYREGGFVPLYAHPPAITADMVEHAAKSIRAIQFTVGFDADRMARAALEAALGVKHD